MRFTIAILAMMIAGSAAAQPCEMIVLFDDNGTLVEQITADPGGLTGHLVLISDVTQVSGFEAGIEVSSPVLIVLSLSGPNGFTNFGSNGLFHEDCFWVSGRSQYRPVLEEWL